METSELAQLSMTLYGACYDAQQWPQLRNALGSMAATLVVRRKQGYATLYSDCDEYYAKKYWRELSSQDPMLAGPNRGEGLYCDQMVMDTWNFRRSALFNDWLHPQDRHSVLLMKVFDARRDVSAIFSFNRGGTQAGYDTADIAAARKIEPLLHHVVHHAHHISQLQTELELNTLYGSGLGYLIVDSRRRILQANDAAHAILRCHSEIFTMEGNRLSLREANMASRMLKGIAQACHGIHSDVRLGGNLLLRDCQGNPALALTIAPMSSAWAFSPDARDAACVLIRSLAPSSLQDSKQHLQLLFDLSPKETELACALLEGYSPREAAHERKVSITTVRSQLSSLFRKTGTSRQGQLIALLARSVPSYSAEK